MAPFGVRLPPNAKRGGNTIVRALSLRRLGLLGGLAGVVMLALLVAIPAFAGSGYNTASDPYVALMPGIDGRVVPLVNSGEEIFGDMFEGIPDGIGAKPGPGNQGYVDLYVAHEQSHVPFGGFADFQDSSVSRVRVDIASMSITTSTSRCPPTRA